jgi:hypothetical protein
MQMKNYKSLAAASFAVLLLAACGSSGIGDILGGGNNQQQYEIRGVVDSVDVNSRSLYLRNVSGMQSMLSGSNSGSTARVYYDDQTQVAYQGRTYRPQDLERGDEVTIRVDESGNQLMAESINVTYDSGGGGTSNSSYTSTVRGTVSYVDTSRRMIELDSTSWISGFRSTSGTGSRMTVYYDANASVDVQGRLHPVANLERGDVIEVRLNNSNTSTPLAQSIVLVRDVNVR